MRAGREGGKKGKMDDKICTFEDAKYFLHQECGRSVSCRLFRVINYKVSELLSLVSVLHRFRSKSAAALRSSHVRQQGSSAAAALAGSEGALRSRSLSSPSVASCLMQLLSPLVCAHTHMHTFASSPSCTAASLQFQPDVNICLLSRGAALGDLYLYSTHRCVVCKNSTELFCTGL